MICKEKMEDYIKKIYRKSKIYPGKLTKKLIKHKIHGTNRTYKINEQTYQCK